MRIALFTDSYTPDINGVVTSIVTLQSALIEAGHDVFVITTHAKLTKTHYENQILRLPGIEIKQMYGYVLTSPVHFKAYNIIKEMDLDIIHVHTEFGAGIFGHIVGKMLKLPIVSTYHTTYEDYTHYVNIFNSKTVDALAKKTVSRLSQLYSSSCVGIIAPSKKTRDMLVRYGIQRDIWVIPTGLNLQRFDKKQTSKETIEQIRSQFTVKSDEKLVLFVGRLAKEKSIDFVIEGFKHVDEMNLPVKFLIVGGGPDEEKLGELVRKLKLQHRIFFAGKKPSDQVPSYYHAADAFVSASQTETQGLTYIEALASESPVFARPDEVLDGLVEEGRTGFFFTTPLEFAQKVSLWCALPLSVQTEMCETAKEQVKIYDSRVFGESVLTAYQEAIRKYYNTYVIEHITIKDEYADVEATNRFEKHHVTLFAETIAKKGLKRKKVIQKIAWEEIQDDQKIVLAYQSCIRKLAIKDRTRKEMYDHLNEKTDCTIAQINAIIDRLELRGYIDDKRYVMAMIMNLRSLLVGKNRIIKSLLQKGIPYEMIQEVLEMEADDSELNMALRWAEKIQYTIGNKSLLAKKQKIYQKLLNQGYDVEIATQVLGLMSFSDDQQNERAYCAQAGEKAKRRFKRKYQDDSKQWQQAIYKALSNQGFKQADIQAVLEEMEWSDE